MWYYGYTDFGAHSTNSPAYEWVKNNIWDGGRKYSDISAGTGLYPAWGNRINMRVYYDWTDSNGRDYKIVIENLDKGHTITISNLWVNGRGYNSLLQSETWNYQNSLKGTQYFADYMDSSKIWHDWTAYSLTVQPTSGNQLCVLSVTADQFKFGTIVGGVCTVP